MNVLRAPLAVVVLLAVLLAAGCIGYVAYFETPDVADPPVPTEVRAAAARRAIMVIIDGFAAVPPIAPAEMPTFTRLGREGAHGVARTSSMSLTAPCVYSLGTGRPGTLLLGILDFHAPPAHVESLPSLVVAAGKRVALAGDPSWGRQFGWLVAPEDRHDHPEPGITLDPRVRRADRSSVEFLFPKLRDDRYGLLVVHLGTADAVGHLVTPFAPEYRDALTFMDGVITDTLAAMDDQTVLLVTGDHGMGPRGTHGGRDDDATMTPYVLWGPGVRAGAVEDVSQTALPATIAALLGLPPPAASEHPASTSLLAIDAPAARVLDAAFLARKLAAARSLVPNLTLPDGLDVGPANARLNEVVFATSDTRAAPRMATAAMFVLAAVIALLLVRADMASAEPRPSLPAQLLTAFVVPVAFAVAAAVLLAWRSALPFQPDALAGFGAALLGIGAVGVALALQRSATARARVARFELTVFFWAAMLLVTPLLTSGWFIPARYFQLLAVALLTAGVVTMGRTRGGTASSGSSWLSMSLLAVSFYGTRFMGSLSSDWPYVVPAALVMLALAAWNLRAVPRPSQSIAAGILLAGAACALAWRVVGGAAPALAMLAVFAAGIAWAVTPRQSPVAAAGLAIGVTTLLGFTMASDPRESIIFLVAGVVALYLSRLEIPLHRPRALYVAALAALALRLALYFSLGDHYNLTSIRTAAGFRLAEAGLSLPLVIATLLLKYALPWLLILAAALPSLGTDDPALARRVVHVLTLGYAARFVAVAAVADPFRVLPHGMEGLVGLFAISWAELLTFAGASLVFVLLSPARPVTVAVPTNAVAQPVR